MSLRKIFLSCILLNIIFNKIMATKLYAHLNEDLPEIVTCKRLQNIFQEPRNHVGIFCQSYMIQMCGDRIFDDLDIELYFRHVNNLKLFKGVLAMNHLQTSYDVRWQLTSIMTLLPAQRNNMWPLITPEDFTREEQTVR